jgi:hypothetical protein
MFGNGAGPWGNLRIAKGLPWAMVFLTGAFLRAGAFFFTGMVICF